MFDLFDSVGLASADAEVEVLARILEADAAARAAGDLGPAGAGSVRELLAGQAMACEQLTRMAQARGLRAVASLVEELTAEDTARACGRGRLIGEFVVDQVAMLLGVSRGTAEVRVGDALAVTTRLPKTLAALEAGILSLPVVRVLVRETENTTPEVAAEAEARVLDALGRGLVERLGRLSIDEIDLLGRLEVGLVAAVAVRATAGAVRTLARRALAGLDAEAVRAQREANRAARDVDTWAGRVGMRWIGAELPEAQAGAVWDRIEATARGLAASPDESRTLGQLRADVFTDLLLGANDGLGGRVPVQLQVTIDRTGQVTAGRAGAMSPEALTDFLALAAASGGRVKLREIAELSCPGVHDTPGRYRPSAALIAAVIARDVTCRFPGCTVPGTVCDIDHTIPHPHGPTCICNLGCLCRHHHRVKTFGGWTLTHHGYGHFTWRDPTGRTYDVWPDRPPPERE